jgi:hypothetical protein
MDEVSGEDNARRQRGANNSSRRRVRPVFTALEKRSDDWVRTLLSLPASHGGACEPRASLTNLRLSPACAEFADKSIGRKERSFKAAPCLLRWLVDNARPRSNQPQSSNPTTRVLRDCLLVHKDPEVRDRALRDLTKGGKAAVWCTFEYPTYPDAVIETPDALVVVEGKFTERGRTTHTTWMGKRDQMLRHLDGAWEARGEKALFGLIAVEGEKPDPCTVPEYWRTACKDLRAGSVLEESLPHRSLQERLRIAQALIGVVTWQGIVAGFPLSDVVLDPRV